MRSFPVSHRPGARQLSTAAAFAFALLAATASMANGQALTASLAPANWTKFTVVQGAKSSAVFTVTGSSSFPGLATMSVSGLPSGVTASWSGTPVALNSSTATVTLTLATNATAPLNQVEIKVTASSNGTIVSGVFWLIVQQPPGIALSLSQSKVTMQSTGTASVTVTANTVSGVTVPAAGGVSAAVVSGLPAGVAASWSGPAATSTSVSWTLTLTGSTAAIASSGMVTLSAQVNSANSGTAYSATAGLGVAVSLSAPKLSFLPANWTKLAVEQGSSNSYLYTFAPSGSFSGPISLAISGLPSGVTASWSGNPIASTSGTLTAMLTLKASKTAKTNYYQFTVTASGDGLAVANPYGLLVEPTVGMFALLSGSVAAIKPKGSATLQVSATALDGVVIAANGAGTSAMVVSGLPSGVTASWSSPTVSAGTATWTLTLNAASGTKASSSSIALAVKITDANSGFSYTAGPGFSLLVSLVASVNISIGGTPGQPIPPDFLGLSHEWGDAQFIMGSSLKGTNRIYRQLLANLTAYGSGPIDIRVGGNSTDATVEPNSTTVMPFAQLFEASGNKFELGVNLGADNVNLAVDQATNYLAQMPAGSVEAIEIGNEPDAYAGNGLRSASYSFGDYFADFGTWSDAISPVLPGNTGFMGPSWAYVASLGNLPQFEADFSPNLSIVSQHYYASSPQNDPAVDFLLTPAAATTGPSKVASPVALTHAYGLPFRIGEINSIADGGLAGISDTFSAALWSIDTMFGLANVGVDGVNWQTTTTDPYSAFKFKSTASSKGTNTYSIASVAPLYYGLLFFQAATANGAQILPVALVAAGNLTAWATVDSSGTTRLAIINKDENLPGTVGITLSGSTQAQVYRLNAPSYQSTSGVQFASQTLDGSTDGTLRGQQWVDTLNAVNGLFHLSIPVTSAALLVFNNSN